MDVKVCSGATSEFGGVGDWRLRDLWSIAALGQGTHRFAIGEQDFLLDGQRLQIRCGEIHFARVPREYWGQRLQAVQGDGPEHRVRVPVLELSRVGPGAVRLVRAGGRRGVLPARAAGGAVGDPAARAVRLCGMGDGRAAVVAAQEGRHPAAHPGPGLPGGVPDLAQGGRPRARTAADHAGRSDPHGAGGERVRLLRRRRAVHGRDAPGVAGCRLRCPAVCLQSAVCPAQGPARRPVQRGQLRQGPRRRVQGACARSSPRAR